MSLRENDIWLENQEEFKQERIKPVKVQKVENWESPKFIKNIWAWLLPNKF